MHILSFQGGLNKFDKKFKYNEAQTPEDEQMFHSNGTEI